MTWVRSVDLNKIEARAEQVIGKKLNEMVTMFQENNIDPIALGDIAKSKTRNFNQKHWEEAYPHIPIEVDLDIEMIQTGIVNKRRIFWSSALYNRGIGVDCVNAAKRGEKHGQSMVERGSCISSVSKEFHG